MSLAKSAHLSGEPVIFGERHRSAAPASVVASPHRTVAGSSVAAESGTETLHLMRPNSLARPLRAIVLIGPSDRAIAAPRCLPLSAPRSARSAHNFGGTGLGLAARQQTVGAAGARPEIPVESVQNRDNVTSERGHKSKPRASGAGAAARPPSACPRPLARPAVEREARGFGALTGRKLSGARPHQSRGRVFT